MNDPAPVPGLESPQNSVAPTGDVNHCGVDPSLAWHRGALRLPIEGYQVWALTYLKRLLRFEHALWGMGAGWENGKAHINSLHLHRLPTSLFADYEPLREVDPIAQAASQNAGKAVVICLADAPWQGERYAGLRAYVSKYGMTNALCVSQYEANSASSQFITLTRAAPGDRFTPQEAQQFEVWAAHMMLAYAAVRQLSVARAHLDDNAGSRAGFAIIDAQGLVHDADEQVHDLLRAEWESWDHDPELPLPMKAFVQQHLKGPHVCGRSYERFFGKRITGEFSLVGDFFLLQLRARSGQEDLSERESFVAKRYASGDSHKEIAVQMGIAPSTVRAHLRNVFSKLNINSKAQLGERLR